MIEIKHRYTGAVLFSADVGNMRLCVEAALTARADIRYADLTSADLTSAIGARGFLSIGPVGSRDDTLLAVIDDSGGVRISTGCFSGSLADFEAAVSATHGDSAHGQHYRLAIALIKAKLGGAA